MLKKVKRFVKKAIVPALVVGAASAASAAPDLTGVTVDTTGVDTAGGIVIGAAISVVIVFLILKVVRGGSR